MRRRLKAETGDGAGSGFTLTRSRGADNEAKAHEVRHGQRDEGNTGEFYALAELSRRGWTAAKTARNTRIYDILARKDAQQVALRVKTKTADARGFQWNSKEE